MTYSYALLAEAKPQDDIADSWINDVLIPTRDEALAAEFSRKKIMRAAWAILTAVPIAWAAS